MKRQVNHVYRSYCWRPITILQQNAKQSEDALAHYIHLEHGVKTQFTSLD